THDLGGVKARARGESRQAVQTGPGGSGAGNGFGHGPQELFARLTHRLLAGSRDRIAGAASILVALIRMRSHTITPSRDKSYPRAYAIRPYRTCAFLPPRAYAIRP